MNQSLFLGRAFVLLASSLLAVSAGAQKTTPQGQEIKNRILANPKVKDVRISEERLSPSMVVLKEENGYTRDQVSFALNNILNVRAGIDQLAMGKQAALPGGFEVMEYQQYFKGVKVDRARYKALVKGGKAKFMAGAYFNIPAGLSLQPAITEAQALERAKATVGAKKYTWEEIQDLMAKNASNKTLVAFLKNELPEYLPKGELVLVQNHQQHSNEVRLAYKFNIYAAEPVSRAWIYVDAANGNILLIDKIIKHLDNPTDPPASVTTTVLTRYAGTQTIRSKQISGTDPNSGQTLVSSHPSSEPTYLPGGATYTLIDDSRGKGIETYDLNNVGGAPYSIGLFYSQGKAFTDVDNNWTAAEHHRSPGNDGALEAENDDIAFDAHWGAEVVYDYWLAKHNRLSYDNNDAKIKNYIHYGPAYDNAFWNGTAMTYGDGSGPAAAGFRALTSLDVCGHEIGHGVCSYTSDLIYQGESGAMNEALSDIWAACIEHFAMTRSGSTVPSTAYRPFYIGEQIAATTDAPLRRMDNPKKLSDPDTYGGQYWRNPICTPNVTNDQCGVHTNSGVLNKWFFLITSGSKTGFRPAGLTPNQYYFADSDDEINDKGNTYQVNGLGFDVSEQITFLMETMLTSSATYAEAREASIQAAAAFSGNPCSGVVESVTNAWYAVGVGPKFVKPCTIKYGFIMQPGGAVNESASGAGCNSEKTISVPVLLPANSTATVSASGTALANIDYVLSTTQLSNTGSTVLKKNVDVVIKNDAVVEGDETVKLTIAVSNTAGNPVNTTYTLTINDDDVVPVIGANDKVLLSETFTRADGFADPQGWTEILEVAETQGDPAATGKNQWGIFGNKLAITGKEGLTNSTFPGGNYNNLSESQTIIRSPLLDSRGLSLLKIKFDYSVQGEVDATSGSTDPETFPVFDYMAVAYSLDGVNFVELNTDEFKQFAAATPTSGTFSANLPLSLANKQFYLAFRWSNDANAGGPVSVTIDNLEVKGAPRTIENDLNDNGRANLPSGQEVYFYSQQDGQLIGKVKNNSDKSFGCTNLFVERTGSGAFNLYQGKDGLHKVSEKIVRVETSLIYKVSNTVTLYFTEAQLQGLENATGQDRSKFSVYRVDEAAYTLASSQNTKKYAATFTPIAGVGGYYTVTFSDKANGSYAIGYPVSVTGTVVNHTAVQPEEMGVAKWQVSNIYPNPGNGAAFVTINAPTSKRIAVDVINVVGQVLYTRAEQVNAGTSKINLPVEKLGMGSYLVRIKDSEGNVLSTQQYTRH